MVEEYVATHNASTITCNWNELANLLAAKFPTSRPKTGTNLTTLYVIGQQKLYFAYMQRMRMLISCLRFLARLHEVHRAIAVTPVVHVPVPVRVPVRVTLALKFSGSPYLDNHSSESIRTWTIDTL